MKFIYLFLYVLFNFGHFYAYFFVLIDRILLFIMITIENIYTCVKVDLYVFDIYIQLFQACTMHIYIYMYITSAYIKLLVNINQKIN